MSWLLDTDVICQPAKRTATHESSLGSKPSRTGGLNYAHVHDGPMRPHVSDTLEADRLKAGGFKPGTWALNDLILRRAHDEMHRHAKRIFQIGLRAVDTIGSQFLGQKFHESVASRLRDRYADDSPQQVVDGISRHLCAAVQHDFRQIELRRMTWGRNELPRRLLPSDVAGDSSIELFIALECGAVERGHRRCVMDGRSRPDAVPVA